MTDEPKAPAGSQDAEKPPTLMQTVGSVGAAFFGVQSSKNRERDFKHGRAWMFIAVGAVMTTLFVLGLVLVVKLMLRNAGM